MSQPSQTPEKMRARAKEQWERNKHDPIWRERRRAQARAWRAKNKERHAAATKAWAEANPERWQMLQRRSKAASRKRPHNRMASNLRKRVRQLMDAGRVPRSNVHINLIGCTRAHLVGHIESLMQPGMTWDNYGKWHVDHRRPLASFDLKKQEDRAACFHYSNLQPLWAADNMRKGAQWEAA